MTWHDGYLTDVNWRKREKKMRGKKDRHEAFGARVAARNKTGWSLLH